MEPFNRLLFAAASKPADAAICRVQAGSRIGYISSLSPLLEASQAERGIQMGLVPMTLRRLVKTIE
jgi:hypothetical protein